ncbi:tRNA-splicing endonuclease subunit Sen34 [Erpetoichthys calabaricus]|uniref:tRNA-splicing endonuclease subunit Sen34 n=1 Tax=Erpetoichthys calabaricus TaxID=27687 RepID=A0A8C4S4V8_ERPCA|nr:tRNA-splicing endonuclease subunit Sen34 [Erpetoichthys calabaricus]
MQQPSEEPERNSECSAGTSGESTAVRQHESTPGGGVEPKEPLIQLYLADSVPLLWRSAHVKLARERLGVVGAAVGSLARQPRQNCRLSRPVQLLWEEARFLLENGRAELVKALKPQNYEQEIQSYAHYLERNHEEQQTFALEEKKQVLKRVMEDKCKDGASAPSSIQSVKGSLDSLESSFKFPCSAVMVQLCTARARFSYTPEERLWLSAELANPVDERQKVRYRVFSDLREKGYYLTSAGKFGGDYLVYPGDPLRFHAHFIAVCVPLDKETPFSDYLSLSRLGSNVKKTILLCSPSQTDANYVHYTSIQWSGMV